MSPEDIKRISLLPWNTRYKTISNLTLPRQAILESSTREAQLDPTKNPLKIFSKEKYGPSSTGTPLTVAAIKMHGWSGMPDKPGIQEKLFARASRQNQFPWQQQTRQPAGVIAATPITPVVPPAARPAVAYPQTTRPGQFVATPISPRV